MTDHTLPVPFERRLELLPERIAYVARPGLRAIPAGTLTMILFMTPQILSVGFFLWAIWWPYPTTRATWSFAVGGTALIAFLLAGVIWLLLRRNLAIARGILQAPFIRLTVTDRRILWQVPWSAHPLMEIKANRVRGGILGPVDRKGCGNAAVILWPGDPAADVDGNMHFDRLPDAAGFVDALSRL